MITQEALQGYVLEELLARLLRESGYRLLTDQSQDPSALVNGRSGLEVKGRGTDHQADALGELSIPTPFAHPLRLFCEAKMTSKPIGLAVVRNALGTISDVNEHFATNNATDTGPPLRRYHYRYSLFSAGGFSRRAQSFALAQQISLIDLSGDAFSDLRVLAKTTAAQLIDLASRSATARFPTAQARAALRKALGTETAPTIESPIPQPGSENDSPPVSRGNGPTLPAAGLAQIASRASEDLTDTLLLGFPQGPFVVVLQPDDPESFSSLLASSGPQIPVNIAFGPNPGNTTRGEWTIRPVGSSGPIVRFGVPEQLERWLLADDENRSGNRITDARSAFFSSISVFHDGGRLTRLVYERLPARRTGTTDVVRLRTLHRDSALTFRGKDERAIEEEVDANYSRGPNTGSWSNDVDPDSDTWSPRAVAALMKRLDEEGLSQANVIRAAARKGGVVSREAVYAIANYPMTRTLRGFTRPTRRIHRRLVSQGLLNPEAAWPLMAQYASGVQASHFIVPNSIVSALSAG